MPERTYILVTASKNEEVNLPCLIESIIKQVVKPVLWIIVDDGSRDNTPEIIEAQKKKYNWIESIHLGEHPRDLSFHYTYVCKTGFDFAIDLCEKNKIKYEYIGLVDADMILPPEYFDNLVEEFKKNPKLGIASGGLWSSIGKKLIQQKSRSDLPSGAARLWRRRCFEETGGYVLAYESDTISNAKAKLRGWECKRCEYIKAIQRRDTSIAEIKERGLWEWYKTKGEIDYYLGLHPLVGILKALEFMFTRHCSGIAYLQGYILSLIKRGKQFEDDEVRWYFRYIRPKEIKKYYWNKLKGCFILRRNDSHRRQPP